MANTTNFRFPLPDFNKRLWHEDYYRSIRTIDAVLAQYIAVNNLQGVWDNGVEYEVGDRVVDDDTGAIYECLVGHTSPASPVTFETSRTNNSTYWEIFGVYDRDRGLWTTATAYSIGDYVYYNNIFARCIVAHTSGATFAGDSVNWAYLIDASAVVPACLAAQVAAELAETNAETAETNAEAAETNAAASAVTASWHATTATTQAGIATTQAGNAAASAAAALTSENNAATSESNAATSETNAANSANAAAASYDSFDDRYLGAKAANPALDNDGDPLIDGALYFNSTANEMRVYDLGTTTWLTTYVPSSSYLTIANNLSDLANASTARTNLGVAIGSDVQAYDATIMKTGAFPTVVSLEGLSLVSGDILYATAADTLARLPKGTDGEVLTLASGVPDWATAGGGGIPVVQTITAASSTYLDFTTGIGSTYDEYEFDFINLVPSVNNTHMGVLFSSNGGSSWFNDYSWTLGELGSGWTITQYSSVATPWIAQGLSNGGPGVNGKAVLTRGGGSLWPCLRIFLSRQHQAGPLWTNVGTVAYSTPATVNAVRFYMNSGVFTSGTARCYGINKT